MTRFSMNARHKLSALLALCLFALTGVAPGAFAESGAYRVELLVFRYTDSVQPPRERDRIRRFPQAWELFEPRTIVYPEDPAPLGVVSDRMRAIWRRLENARDIDPLYLQTWEQSRIDFQPPVRVHDDQVLLQRVELPSRWAEIDLTVADFFAPYRESYYRLDGTVQLRRSRFLHLDLDLEYRTALLRPHPDEAAVTQSAPAPGTPSPAKETSPGDGGSDSASRDRLRVLRPEPYWNPPEPRFSPMSDDGPALPGVRVYALRQSRQVKTDELMYFDTANLGVIARVTATAGE